MTYGKNQRALLTFLEKHPNRWHRIKSKKAIKAADRLKGKENGFLSTRDFKTKQFYVLFKMPQMLIKQN